MNKYEPIFIQRQITHTLQNVLEDPRLLWRLNWYNDIKMPLLTTLLMCKSDVSIKENMDKFTKIIELKALTSEEMFMKNACKSNQMQQKAIELILEAMRGIMESDEASAMREVNIDAFIQNLNKTLMSHDPAFAASKGIKEKGTESERPKF